MRFYVTTPIYYINDVPSVGSAYPTVAADILARWHRSRGEEVFFLTGLDEHSVKTTQAAKAKGQEDIKAYADEMASKWRAVWAALNISNDDFIRTTERRHRENVESVLQKVIEKGDVYKGKYSGFYCEGCEAFYLDKDLVDGKCPLHLKVPSYVEEENYFFKLSKYQNEILAHIEDNKGFIVPESRRNEILSFIKDGLKDISVSRPGLTWGIPFPADPKHVVWVWFDALVNYLIAGKWWPADVHIVGKDINRFHSVIWPGMLMSAGLPLPKTVLAHGFFTVNGQKMSKSLGNAIDPVHITNKYTVDTLRYYLFAEIHFGDDGNFSEESLKARHNNELVANFSNLFYRATSFVEKNFEGKVPEPKISEDEEMVEERLEVAAKDYEALLGKYQLTEALSVAMTLSADINKYFQQKEPWKAIKTDRQSAATALFTTLNAVKTLAILLYPYLPSTCERALAALGSDPNWEAVGKFTLSPGQEIKSEILFRKID